MKKFLYMLGAIVVFGLIAPGVASAGHFHTKVTPADLKWSDCANLKDWYVNSDEESRKPTPTIDGLQFKGNQLIHRTTDIKLGELKPGSYALATGSDSPDQPSFFSVEVRNTNGAYGTLRWNPTDSKWYITISAGNAGTQATDGTFSHADPVTLLTGKASKWGAFDTATAKVVSFGVGYTNSPPGTKTAVVKSVSFQGGVYLLTCPPPVMPSPSASKSPSASASASAAPPAAGQDSLPVTGARVYSVLGAGAILTTAGIASIWVSRRKRRVEFKS